ncbi:hypothetical protein DXG01_002267 [Tephrocybe rancida]|nr:hypothetical protein DXG01_002267 [Tephrocybe rancida]
MSMPTTKKDRKSKRKSIGDAPVPSADKVIEVDVPEPKTEAVKQKKQKKGKGKVEAVEEAEKPQEFSPPPPPPAPAPISVPKAERKKKTKGEAVKAVEKSAESAPAPAPAPEAPVSAGKQKKRKAKGGHEKAVEVPEKAAPAPAPVPKSISATSKASAPSKASKSSEKSSKKSKKAKEPSPSPSPAPEEVEDAEEVVVDEEDDEDADLHGFSTDDDDSSDEEDVMDHEPSIFDISKLPTIAKDDKTVQQKLAKAKRQPTEDRGVLYLGRVPHGFYEDQMRGYFSQFGNVTRVRLSRNKKTGRSKHYGFVEFDSSSVAQIVAETMDNYLLTGHILRCKVIPKDEVHPELWVGANRKWRVVPQDRLTRVEHNKERTEEEQSRAAKRLIKRQNDRKRKLADSGIKYNFEAVSYKKTKEA